MKAIFFSQEDWNAKSTEPLTLASVASYLLPDSFPRWALTMFLCTASSWGGLLLARAPWKADILWPANGIVLAFLMVTPRRFWTSYLAGGVVSSVLVHQVLGFPPSFSLIFTAANTVEVFLAAFWLAPPDRHRPDLTNLKTIGNLLLYGVLLAPLVSALVVELSLLIWFQPAKWVAMSNLYVGDAFGIAIMTPLVLAFGKTELASMFSRARWLETVSILAGLTLISFAVFAHTGAPLIFLLFPPLLLMIFRLGSSGSAIGLFLMCVPAAYFTSQWRGPFVMQGTGLTAKLMQIHSIFLLQCFLGVSLVAIYSVSVALAERNRQHMELTVAYREADTNAAIDHVTGLANRRAFDRHLDREWRRAIRENVCLSLIMIDVDQFKLYNDNYGHVAGDACLRAVGAVLRDAPLRASDLAARYGGEEFAIILPRAAAEGAFLLADRIRQTIADQCLPHRAHTPGIVTVSMGVATIQPRPEGSEISLIEMADLALYLAKKEGRDQVRSWEVEAGIKPVKN